MDRYDRCLRDVEDECFDGMMHGRGKYGWLINALCDGTYVLLEGKQGQEILDDGGLILHEGRSIGFIVVRMVGGPE